MNLDTAMLSTLPRKMRKMLRNFAKQPTERNACYATGYLVGVWDRDSNLLSIDHYNYLLALVGVAEADPAIARELFLTLEQLP
jgi:hypothetical protein